MTTGCTGTAFIFSGRPDPEWPVSAEAKDRLDALWARLAPGAETPPDAPPLGYRGCALRCPQNEEWTAYGGVVSRRSGDGSPERRADPARAFERALLATAPGGTLPDGLA